MQICFNNLHYDLLIKTRNRSKLNEELDMAGVKLSMSMILNKCHWSKFEVYNNFVKFIYMVANTAFLLNSHIA